MKLQYSLYKIFQRKSQSIFIQRNTIAVNNKSILSFSRSLFDCSMTTNFPVINVTLTCHIYTIELL